MGDDPFGDHRTDPGKIVELGSALDIMERPQHPYTRTLISAIPRVAR